MYQVGIKLKMYLPNINVLDNTHTQKRMLSILLWSFGAMAIFYMLILGNMVWNIIERKASEAQARNILTEMGEMELTYLSMSSKIDPNFGRSLGFTDTIDKKFATRKSLGSLDGKKIVKNDL